MPGRPIPISTAVHPCMLSLPTIQPPSAGHSRQHMHAHLSLGSTITNYFSGHSTIQSHRERHRPPSPLHMHPGRLPPLSLPNPLTPPTPCEPYRNRCPLCPQWSGSPVLVRPLDASRSRGAADRCHDLTVRQLRLELLDGRGAQARTLGHIQLLSNHAVRARKISRGHTTGWFRSGYKTLHCYCVRTCRLLQFRAMTRSVRSVSR